jgi:hypothetical protein
MSWGEFDLTRIFFSVCDIGSASLVPVFSFGENDVSVGRPCYQPMSLTIFPLGLDLRTTVRLDLFLSRLYQPILTLTTSSLTQQCKL